MSNPSSREVKFYFEGSELLSLGYITSELLALFIDSK